MYHKKSIFCVSQPAQEHSFVTRGGGGEGGGVTCTCRGTGMCHYFGYFFGCSQIFRYLLGLFTDFWVSFFLVKFFSLGISHILGD